MAFPSAPPNGLPPLIVPPSEPRLNFVEILFWQILLTVVAIALIASYYTNTGLYSPWYNQLPEAPWFPPVWLFVFAWTFIYLVVGFTAYIAIKLDPYPYVFLALLVAGLMLHVLWALAFFTFEDVTWGLGLNLALDAVLLVQVLYLFGTGVRFKRHALTGSGALLTLYLAWSIYTSTLNGYIWAHTAA